MHALPLISCCKPLAASTLSNAEAESTATLFRALADPARVKIVNRLVLCAFGLDTTDEMLALARRNAAEAGITNAIFLKGVSRR